MIETKNDLKREFVAWVQYFLLALIATIVAFDSWERTHLVPTTQSIEGLADEVNVKGMLFDLWSAYYRWWLCVFVGLSALRFLVLFILSRMKNRVSLD